MRRIERKQPKVTVVHCTCNFLAFNQESYGALPPKKMATMSTQMEEAQPGSKVFSILRPYKAPKTTKHNSQKTSLSRSSNLIQNRSTKSSYGHNEVSQINKMKMMKKESFLTSHNCSKVISEEDSGEDRRDIRNYVRKQTKEELEFEKIKISQQRFAKSEQGDLAQNRSVPSVFFNDGEEPNRWQQDPHFAALSEMDYKKVCSIGNKSLSSQDSRVIHSRHESNPSADSLNKFYRTLKLLTCKQLGNASPPE